MSKHIIELTEAQIEGLKSELRTTLEDYREAIEENNAPKKAFSAERIEELQARIFHLETMVSSMRYEESKS